MVTCSPVVADKTRSTCDWILNKLRPICSGGTNLTTAFNAHVAVVRRRLEASNSHWYCRQIVIVSTGVVATLLYFRSRLHNDDCCFRDNQQAGVLALYSEHQELAFSKESRRTLEPHCSHCHDGRRNCSVLNLALCECIKWIKSRKGEIR
jgi:hypothetical protein